MEAVKLRSAFRRSDRIVTAIRLERLPLMPGCRFRSSTALHRVQVNRSICSINSICSIKTSGSALSNQSINQSPCLGAGIGLELVAPLPDWHAECRPGGRLRPRRRHRWLRLNGVSARKANPPRRAIAADPRPAAGLSSGRNTGQIDHDLLRKESRQLSRYGPSPVRHHRATRCQGSRIGLLQKDVGGWIRILTEAD